MTATTHSLTDLKVQLIAKEAAFKILKTPALRRQVKQLKERIAAQEAVFLDPRPTHQAHRRRGTKMAKVVS